MVDTKSPQSQRLLNHFPLSRVVSTWYVPPSETPKTRRYFRGPLMLVAKLGDDDKARVIDFVRRLAKDD